jgi:predicted acyl esterase
MAQGRRDFLFGIDQAIAGYSALRGPKALWLGLQGHPPSTFPAADTTRLLLETHAWFDCYLRHEGCSGKPAPVTIVPQNFDGDALRATGIRTYASLPKRTSSQFDLAGRRTIAQGGKAVGTTRKLRGPIETFGSPTVRLSVTPRKGWSRLVAVLSALTPGGGETVIGAGGVPLTGSKSRRVVIRLSDQVTFVPRGSRLRLAVGSSSLVQSPSNLLYLDLPMPQGASVRVGPATLTVPRLRTPVTK